MDDSIQTTPNVDDDKINETVAPQEPPVDNSTNPTEQVAEGLTPDQVDELKQESIQYAKSYAKTGVSSRKEPSSNLANDQGPYYWWNKQATYESNTWSISLWEYDNKTWQLQATKVELQPDGKSHMTAYSMRKDSDTSFPGFQVYREQMDDRYHKAAIEDIVYLNRVLKGLVDTIK
jgi:hypothetical protein